MALLNKLFHPFTSIPTTTTPTTVTNYQKLNEVTTAATSSSSSPSTTKTTAAAAVAAAAPVNTTGTAPKQQRQQQQKQKPYGYFKQTKNLFSQFPFDGTQQVRILLYRECDSRGRRILFDSNALEKVYLKETKDNMKLNSDSISNQKRQKHSNRTTSNTSTSTTTTTDGHCINVCNEYAFKHTRPKAQDIACIGEMVFGALAMSYCGTTLKLHWLQHPTRMLCSQVFLTPIRSTTSMMGSSSLSYTVTDATPTATTGTTNTISTTSMRNLATPRTSISSDQSSIDGTSMSAFSMAPFMDKLLQTSSPPYGLEQDNYNMTIDSGLGLSSSVASTGADSAYSTISRKKYSNLSNSYWSYSYQMSLRNSLGSVKSDQQQQQQSLSLSYERLKKMSIDSGYYYPIELTDNARNLSSDFNMNKRISRNLITSLENENSINDFIGYLSDHYATNCYQNSDNSEGSISQKRATAAAAATAIRDKILSHSNSEIEQNTQNKNVFPNVKVARRPRLGLALCLTFSESYEEEMELFCSEHIALIECLLSRLRAKTEQAYMHHENFLQIMFHTWQDAQQWFHDIFLAPRLKSPVWLGITTTGNKYSKNIAERFIKELCWLLSIADTKDTNFFISTLITAILTYHSGWISTVHSSQTTLNDIEMVKMNLLRVSQKYPYNALWAQIGDLYGANSMPPKLSRTIIYGKEKLSIERLLNVLTYFIRCSEVKRSSKIAVLNKENLQKLMTIKSNSTNCTNVHEVINQQNTGFHRTQTLNNKLNVMMAATTKDNDMKKRNDIPIVLAYRDSHFVQQELRIGNYLMDTGIEKAAAMAEEEHQRLRDDDVTSSIASATVTADDAVEAVVIDTFRTHTESERHTCKNIKSNKLAFWRRATAITPIEDGLSLQSTIKQEIPKQQLMLPQQQQQQSPTIKELSLSQLITKNSLGLDDSERLQWGIEPIKENVTLEEQMHFDIAHKLLIEQRHINNNSHNSNNNINNPKYSPNVSRTEMQQNQLRDVVFVLGENEPLVNIKCNRESSLATNENQRNTITTEETSNSDNNNKTSLFTCPVHHCDPIQNNNSLRKSRTSVRFNFEQYPQIVNNYMRNKNFTIQSNYNYSDNIGIDTVDSGNDYMKGKNNNSNQEMESGNVIFKMPKLLKTKSHNTLMDVMTSSQQCPSCDICNTDHNNINYYQTPSNATEVEFEDCLSTESIKTIMDEKIREDNHLLKNKNKSKSDNDDADGVTRQQSELQQENEHEHKQENYLPLLELPMPDIKDLSQDFNAVNNNGNIEAPVGLIPSLFLGINDHYVHDVVLQGTTAPPSKWDKLLREDLTLATHSASLISLPVENIAIVADMEKWDVKLLSSTQFQNFNKYNAATSEGSNPYTPIGMSQLVSSILETVQTMRCVGASAYECLSFIELKLQEIYLHSETLAAFLMETEFCSLNTITTALNLTENDVPLLLSIATTHTPQIAKKCGITFR